MPLIDRYLLRSAFWPMVAALGVTLTALLLERVLKLLDLLSASSDRFGFVTELALDLVPHYLGLTLPAAFFVAMFVVVIRLSDGSEIDVLLAAGVSLTRILAPYMLLASALSMVSLLLFGFVQPGSRYAYRAVLHAAQNAGWSGRLQGGAVVASGERLTLTADASDSTGRRLQRVWVREMGADGLERVTTARRARLEPAADPGVVAMTLEDGQQVRTEAGGAVRVLRFERLALQAPLARGQRLARLRGGDERELTLTELAGQAGSAHSQTPRRALLAELYARIARSLSILALPLLALPMGLAAKRGGRAPGIIAAALLLVGFQHLLQLGQSLAETGRVSPAAGVGGPFLLFVAVCIWLFLTSRNRPGDTPLARASARWSEALRQVRGSLAPRTAGAAA